MIKVCPATIAVAILVAVGAPGVAPASAADALPTALSAGIGTVAVRIDNFTFTPTDITVTAGTTVTWTNGDDIPHTVVASDRSFRSPVLDTDEGFSFTFTAIGTFEYFCSLHPHMVGIIRVVAS
ncbi:amicyanin [Siculibacillus lacustris]|uniref:Amicyanin n=1 Tax=Siculibacillus lacustris TaxID=1549641 RepID=A0A4Q9VPG6_9HYPH|nr:cupredoxin family copper-binding protein [Siculibacillus lacustris]TBW36802.1 amicyanin [Siculibacillus lacustris]